MYDKNQVENIIKLLKIFQKRADTDILIYNEIDELLKTPKKSNIENNLSIEEFKRSLYLQEELYKIFLESHFYSETYDPSVEESGKYKSDNNKISKRGSSFAKRALYFIALASIRKEK